VDKAMDLFLNDHYHLVGGAVLIGCMFRKLFNIGAEPSYISGGPLA